MTLTRISVVTGLLTLLVQGLVLFGVNLTGDQQAWITSFIVALGGAVHALYIPDVPIGRTS